MSDTQVEAGDIPGSATCVPKLSDIKTVIVDQGAERGFYASAAVRPDANPCVAFAAKDDSTKIRLACWEGAGWSFEDFPALMDTEWIGRSLALVFGHDGRFFVIYREPNRGLVVLSQDKNGFGVENVDGREGAGLDVSAALGPDGRLHIAYFDFIQGDLLYAAGKPGSWVKEVVDDSGFTGNDPSIAVDSTGAVHVTYFGCGQLSESGCTGELRYATRKEDGFQTSLVESGNDTGWYSSLALDNEGTPHVAWYVHGLRALRYGVLREGSWLIEEVDSGPGVGEFASLVLAYGRPIIAYSQNQEIDGLVIVLKSPDGSWLRTLVPRNKPARFSSLVRLDECKFFCAWQDQDGVLSVFF